MSRRSAFGLAGLLTTLALAAGVGALAVSHRPPPPASAASVQVMPAARTATRQLEDD